MPSYSSLSWPYSTTTPLVYITRAQQTVTVECQYHIYKTRYVPDTHTCL